MATDRHGPWKLDMASVLELLQPNRDDAMAQNSYYGGVYFVYADGRSKQIGQDVEIMGEKTRHSIYSLNGV